ncbi:hypothetical protein ACE2AJ_09725 [Aquihabitans daechungensis]
MSMPPLRLPLTIDLDGHVRDLTTAGRRAVSVAGIVALHALERTTRR